MLIEQYPAAFSILKWVGAAYLVAIGLYGIVTAKAVEDDGSAAEDHPASDGLLGHVRGHGAEPEDDHFLRRLHAAIHVAATSTIGPRRACCSLTFCVVVTLSDGFYAVAASWVAGYLKGPKVHLWSQRVGGAVLALAGVATATMNALRLTSGASLS